MATREREAEIVNFLQDAFGLCGCSEFDEVKAVLLGFLRWAKIGPAEGRRQFSSLYPQLGMFYIVAGILDEHGLIEHGTAIRHPWITESGKRLLADLEEIDLDLAFDREHGGEEE